MTEGFLGAIQKDIAHTLTDVIFTRRVLFITKLRKCGEERTGPGNAVAEPERQDLDTGSLAPEPACLPTTVELTGQARTVFSRTTAGLSRTPQVGTDRTGPDKP